MKKIRTNQRTAITLFDERCLFRFRLFQKSSGKVFFLWKLRFFLLLLKYIWEDYNIAFQDQFCVLELEASEQITNLSNSTSSGERFYCFQRYNKHRFSKYDGIRGLGKPTLRRDGLSVVEDRFENESSPSLNVYKIFKNIFKRKIVTQITSWNQTPNLMKNLISSFPPSSLVYFIHVINIITIISNLKREQKGDKNVKQLD